MAVEETQDEVVGSGNSQGKGFTSRKVVEDFVDEGGRPAMRRGSDNGVEQDDVREGGRRPRAFKPETLKLFDALEGPADKEEVVEETVDDESASGEQQDDPALEGPADEDTEQTDEEQVEASGDEEQQAAAVAPKGKPAAKPPGEVELDKLRAENARLAETNRRLVTEGEEVRRRPAPKMDMTERLKALDEIDRTYFDDPMAAHRKLVALALGSAKHDAPEVDEEMSNLYTDLTARELKVPLEQATKAARDAARAKQMLARDKRERQADTQAQQTPAPADEEAAQIESASKYIEPFISEKEKPEQQSIAEEFPLLMNLAEDMDGCKPTELLARVVRRDIKAGILPAPTTRAEERLVLRAAAKHIEDHYSAFVDKVTKAKTSNKQTDTAKTGNKQANGANKEQRQGQAARTITNASASVAPASSPAKKTAQQNEKPRTANQKKAEFLNKWFDKRGNMKSA